MNARASWLLALLTLGCEREMRAGASSQEPLTPEVSLLREMQSSLDIAEVCQSCEGRTPVVLIRESDFLEAAGAKAFSGPEFKRFGAELAAIATDRGTLGVFATPTSGQVEGEVFLVAPEVSDLDGVFETRHFYIAVAKVTVTGAIGVNPKFALASPGYEAPACNKAPVNGCRPLATAGGVESIHSWASGDKGAGLSPDIILNAEAPSGGANASGASPELRLYWTGEGVTNRFACHGIVELGACEGLAVGLGEDVLSGTRSAVDFPADEVVLISERDVGPLLAASEPVKPTELEAATAIAAASNLAEAVGVVAQQGGAQLASGSIFLVARDLSLDKSGNIQAREFYVLARRLFGELPMVGIHPKLVTSIPWPRLPVLRGPCGLISTIREVGYCGPLECLPNGISVYANPSFGEERWVGGRARTTLRIPGSEKPTSRVSVYSCNDLLPPPLVHKFCSVGPEACNAEDDNCNGAIDEGGVCETRCTP